MKILLVDDNPADRKLLRYILERRGFETIEARDGEEGLEVATRHHPGLIISDALMPKMDGFQFLRKAKSDPVLRDIPFVFYSSVYTGARDEKLALSLGADAFLIKPKKPDELWAEVNAILERGKPQAERIKDELLEEEEEYLRQYTHIVTAKIEEKVSELEKANAAIQQKAKSYRNLFNSIRDVMLVTDDEHRVLGANQPALRETFGYETEEVVGRDEKIFYPEGTEHRTFCRVRSGIRGCGRGRKVRN